VTDQPADTRDAKDAEIAAAATWLGEHLGSQLAAFVTGEGPRARQRALVARRAASTIHAAYGDTHARSWLMGENPTLGGRAPATVLRDSTDMLDWARVEQAATDHAAGAP
jgi:hypothetical protein